MKIARICEKEKRYRQYLLTLQQWDYILKMDLLKMEKTEMERDNSLMYEEFQI